MRGRESGRMRLVRGSLRRGVRLAQAGGKAQGLSCCLLYLPKVCTLVPGRLPKRLHHLVELFVIAVDEQEFIVARGFERRDIQIAKIRIDCIEPLPNGQVESIRWRLPQ